MNTIKIVAALMLSVLLMTSCVFKSENGELLAQNSTFDAIEVYNGIEVILTQDETVKYTVEGSENAKSKLEMNVLDGTLRIMADGLKSEERITINLFAPLPVNITAFNGSKITNNGSLVLDRLDIITWNNSSIILHDNVKVFKLNMEANNSSIIEIDSVQSNDINIMALNNSKINLSGASENVTISNFNNAVVNATGLKYTNSAKTDYSDN